MATTELQVNGAVRKIEGGPDRPLLGVLRDDLGLTGSKYGCGEGRCGACTVLLDGKAARSCVTPLAAAEGKEVRTIEGREKLARPPPPQQPFLGLGAFRCGSCSPGVIMAGAAPLRQEHDPSPQDVA